MKNKREVRLIKFPNNELALIPMEQFMFSEDYCDDKVVCKIIIQHEKLSWWIFEKSIPGGASDGIGPEIVVRDITEKDIDTILKNGGRCFVEVDYKNKVCMPANMLGNKKVVIFMEDAL